MPDATQVLATIDESLAHRVGLAGRLLRNYADAELVDLGIGAQALGVLLRLMEAEGVTQAELSRRQRVEAPTMCRMLDRLERDGLVERRRDESDRRASRVHLTTAGRVVAERGTGVVDMISTTAFAGLDADERRQLGTLLGRVIARMPASGSASS